MGQLAAGRAVVRLVLPRLPARARLGQRRRRRLGQAERPGVSLERNRRASCQLIHRLRDKLAACSYAPDSALMMMAVMSSTCVRKLQKSRALAQRMLTMSLAGL